MTRALLVLLLTLVHIPIIAAPRQRAVAQPGKAPNAIAETARQAAEEAMKAGVPGVQVAVARHGRIIYSAAFGRERGAGE